MLACRVAAIAITVAGCRAGFEHVYPADGVADAAVDAVVLQPPDCSGASVQLVVTTAVDELDASESATPPHESTGLSLREAISIANNTPGRECVVFASPMTIAVVATDLPALVASDGVVIDGGRAVTLTGSGIGLTSIAGGNMLRGLALSGFDIGIVAGTGSTQIVGVRVEASRIGIELEGTANELVEVRVSGCSSQGVHIKDGSNDTVIVRALFHDNVGQGLKVGSGTGTIIRHATFHGNDADALKVEAGASNVTIENSIFAGNGGAVRALTAGSFAVVDHIAVFQNVDDTCGNCSYGANLLSADPLFVDPTSGNFHVAPGSPAIDAGTDRGIDVNGASSGAFNGSAPDLGAFEAP